MLRATIRKNAAAPLFKAQPTTIRELNDTQVISRLLGGRNERFGTVQSFTSILDKSNGKLAAARMGRSMSLMQRGDTQHALGDIDTYIKATGAEGTDACKDPLAQTARALRQQIYFRMLQDEQDRAMVSGGANEANIDTYKNVLRKEFADTIQIRQQCWSNLVAFGEFEMVEDKMDVAVGAFNRALKLIEADSARRMVTHRSYTTGASLESIVAHKLQRRRFANSVDISSVKHKDIQDAIRFYQQHPIEELDTLRGGYGVDALTDEEVGDLAAVIASAHTQHHFFDLFPESSDYNVWNSGHAQALRNRIDNFLHPRTTLPDIDREMAGVERAHNACYVSEESLEAALASVPAGTHVLDHLDSTLGVCPTTAMSERDHVFHKVLSTLDQYYKEHPCPSRADSKDADDASKMSSDLTKYHDKLIHDLLAQVAYRCKVSKSVALDKMGKHDEAKKLLDGVIEEDKMIEMWKALLARGRVARQMGLVDQAEHDFSALFSLKRLSTDIPPLDVHRYKSAF